MENNVEVCLTRPRCRLREALGHGNGWMMCDSAHTAHQLVKYCLHVSYYHRQNNCQCAYTTKPRDPYSAIRIAWLSGISTPRGLVV
jgi:hypothetical protein